MILDDKTQRKPEIAYPTSWGFKIIGRDKEKLLACIKEVMGDREHCCHQGNSSSKGNFHTYNASCEVIDQEDRDRIFDAFSKHPDVKIVI